MDRARVLCEINKSETREQARAQRERESFQEACANMNRSLKNLLPDKISLSPSSFTARAILAMPRSLAEDIVCECFKDKNDSLFVLSI